MSRKVTRRELLRSVALTGSVALVAACQPKTVEIEKEVTKIVKEVVKETVIIEGTPKVIEKEVTRIVEKEAKPVSEPVTISFLSWPWGEVIMTDFVDVFQKRQDKVQVELNVLGWADYWDKLATLFAAGSAPDGCMEHPSRVKAHIKLGALRQVNDYIAVTPNWPTDWIMPVWNLFTHEGGVYGVVIDNAIRSLYYNKTLFQEAGIDQYPAKGWTWDDMREWGTKITVDRSGKGPNDEGFDPRAVEKWGISGMLCGWGMCLRQQMIAFGTEFLNEDETECTITDPGAIEFCKWYQDAINVWHIVGRR